MDWVEDQDNVITLDDLNGQFGDMAADDFVGGLEEKDSQLHVALQTLTEGESFDIVLSAGPRGVEALRRLVRRWDPASGGRRRTILRQILVPDR
eukprot:11184049-Lingulodinium_polyedra.AAC.1